MTGDAEELFQEIMNELGRTKIPNLYAVLAARKISELLAATNRLNTPVPESRKALQSAYDRVVKAAAGDPDDYILEITKSKRENEWVSTRIKHEDILILLKCAKSVLTHPAPKEEPLGFATSAELFEALGSSPEKAAEQERGLNAVMRREKIKNDNKIHPVCLSAPKEALNWPQKAGYSATFPAPEMPPESMMAKEADQGKVKYDIPAWKKRVRDQFVEEMAEANDPAEPRELVAIEWAVEFILEQRLPLYPPQSQPPAYDVNGELLAILKRVQCHRTYANLYYVFREEIDTAIANAEAAMKGDV